MGKYNFKHQKKCDIHEWNTGITERWNSGKSRFHYSIIPTFHVYNEILMLNGFQPSIIEKISKSLCFKYTYLKYDGGLL